MYCSETWMKSNKLDLSITIGIFLLQRFIKTFWFPDFQSDNVVFRTVILLRSKRLHQSLKIAQTHVFLHFQDKDKREMRIRIRDVPSMWDWRHERTAVLHDSREFLAVREATSKQMQTLIESRANSRTTTIAVGNCNWQRHRMDVTVTWNWRKNEKNTSTSCFDDMTLSNQHITHCTLSLLLMPLYHIISHQGFAQLNCFTRHIILCYTHCTHNLSQICDFRQNVTEIWSTRTETLSLAHFPRFKLTSKERYVKCKKWIWWLSNSVFRWIEWQS